MNLDEILAELKDYSGVFPKAAVEAAVLEREAITPHLLRALDEAVHWGCEGSAGIFHLRIA